MPNVTMPTRSGGAVRTAPQNDDNEVDTQNEGAEDRSGSAEERLGSREALFARIDAQRNAAVQEDVDYAFETGDPAAAQAEVVRRARKAKDKEAPAKAEADEQDESSAAASAGKAAPADGNSDEGRVDTDVDADPYGGRIVEQDGKAMVKLKVDGKERFVSLDTAIAQLQKGTAAEVRLQEAAGLRRQLDARQADLDAREAKLKSQPSIPPVAADDPGLDAEVQGVVDSLLTDDPKVAASKLKAVIVKGRQAPPPIDEATIIDKAVKATRKTLAADDANKSLVTGYAKFQTEYPEIAKDPKLERMADGMTDAIAAEHPEWSPEQVMLESGKQTREWLSSLRGDKPTEQKATERDLTAVRRDRKEGLRPLPAQRTGRQASAKPADQAETPQSIVAQMRAARGQA